MSFDQKTLDSLKIERDAPTREPASGRSWLVGIVLVAAVAAGAGWWSVREQPIEVELATAAAAPAGSAGAQAWPRLP